MNEIETTENNFSLSNARTFAEAKEIALMLSKSGMVPNNYRGKPDDILIAVDMGKGLGFKALQSLQTIAVINGMPCIWGDSMLALVRTSPEFADIKETIKNGVATCTVKRMGKHGMQESSSTFSVDDASKAKLWGKQGPWSNYPNRMLQMRARGFALRDMFSDVLRGLKSAEEVQDYELPNLVRKTVVSIEEAKNKIELLLKKKSQTSSVDNLQTVEESSTVQEVDEDVVYEHADSEAKNKAVYNCIDSASTVQVKELADIILAQKIPNSEIEKWMERGNATSLSELKSVTVEALINKYKEI